jgi:putative transposase
MALEGYKSNHNVVYSSKYHCVWTPKYRRAVPVGPMAKRCEQVLRQVAAKYRAAEILAFKIMPDQVHGPVEVDPQFGIHRLVKNLKGVSWHRLRPEFRTLKSRLPTRWTNRYFVSTVGGAPLAVIKPYVENQKNV